LGFVTPPWRPADPIADDLPEGRFAGRSLYLMPKPARQSPLDSGLCALRLALALAGIVASNPMLSAHDLFAAYVQHRVAIVVGARHVDVTVQLTFFEDAAEHEREHMDVNGDGRVSRAEIEATLERTAPALATAVQLRVAGKAVELIPLFEPALDLLGNDRLGRNHLQLTLKYFAPTPADLAAGAELVVEDRLWTDTRALGVVQTEGKDGCRLEPLPPKDPAFPPTRDGEGREFKARVLAPPPTKAAPPASLSNH